MYVFSLYTNICEFKVKKKENMDLSIQICFKSLSLGVTHYYLLLVKKQNKKPKPSSCNSNVKLVKHGIQIRAATEDDDTLHPKNPYKRTKIASYLYLKQWSSSSLPDHAPELCSIYGCQLYYCFCNL